MFKNYTVDIYFYVKSSRYNHVLFLYLWYNFYCSVFKNVRVLQLRMPKVLFPPRNSVVAIRNEDHWAAWKSTSDLPNTRRETVSIRCTTEVCRIMSCQCHWLRKLQFIGLNSFSAPPTYRLGKGFTRHLVKNTG